MWVLAARSKPQEEVSKCTQLINWCFLSLGGKYIHTPHLTISKPQSNSLLTVMNCKSNVCVKCVNGKLKQIWFGHLHNSYNSRGERSHVLTLLHSSIKNNSETVIKLRNWDALNMKLDEEDPVMKTLFILMSCLKPLQILKTV